MKNHSVAKIPLCGKISFLLYFCIFNLFISENIFSQNGWYQIYPGNTNYYFLSFVNSETGYCTGYQRVLKTTNGGLNWQIYPTSPYYACFIQFINTNTGYVFDNGSNPKNFLKTTNGGSNWIVIQTQFIGPAMQGFYFTNENTGFVGDNWNLYKTTNAGLSWNNVFNYTNYIVSFKFIDSNTGFAAAQDAILKTTNQGINWYVTSLIGGPSMKYILSFSIVNNYIIYAAGYYGQYTNGPLLYKSTDVGENWNLMPTSDTLINFQGIWFVDSTKCYLPGGQLQGINFSTNSGYSWNMQYSGLVVGIFFINNLTGYAAGEYGTGILKTTTGGLTFVKRLSDNIPRYYSLHQNYPNPFNPTTKIKFDIPNISPPFTKGGQGGLTTLIIYDILGREVATLVNEQLKPGSYEYEWDGSKYASGVYFYRLTILDPESSSGFTFSQTKKLVLIK